MSDAGSFKQQESQSSVSDISRSSATFERSSNRTRKTRKNFWLIMSAFVVLVTTPIAIFQMRHTLKFPFIQLKKRYWVLKPLILPANSDLPYIATSISAISHNNRSLWIGGDGGFLASSDDDGKTWTPNRSLLPTDETSPSVLAIQWNSDADGELVANDGTVYGTKDGGVTWNPDSSVQKSVDETGVIGGVKFAFQGNGKLLRREVQVRDKCASTINNISTVRDNNFVQMNPYCVIRPNSGGQKRGWFVDPQNQHVLKVFNGEPNGAEAITASSLPTASFLFPAPWYLLIALPTAVILLILAALARHHKIKPQPEVDSIANIGVSDRPLQWDDKDATGLRALARGISLFLRNTNTGLPLVVAVNGRWGSGKSSLMNLLRANMRSAAQTVWFNAWHHESEEQLLAALLQAVRTQSLGAIWSLAGVRRRLQLLVIRLKAIWPTAIGMLGLIVALLLIASHFIERLDKSLLSASPQFSTSLKTLAGLVSSLVAAGGVFLKLKDIVGSLIANPANLLASSSGKPTLSDLSAQTTFRQRFSVDFTIVIKILGRRRLVIIIDDLDRCRPEKIREIMEGINFLVSSGDCIVVLGLARENVEQFLGYSFKDAVAKMPVELLELKPGEPCGEDDKPRFFARLYLEKLIQIDIPVPELTEGQARSVISGDVSRDPAELSEEEKKARENAARRMKVERQLRSTFRALDRWSGPVLGSLFIGILLIGLIKVSVPFINRRIDQYMPLDQSDSGNPSKAVTIGGIDFQVEEKRLVLSEGALPVPNSGQLRKAFKLDGSTSDGKRPTLEMPRENGGLVPVPLFSNSPTLEQFITPARPASLRATVLVLGFLLLVLAAILLRLSMSISESLEVQDLPSFKKALRDWFPLIHYVFRSPRALKRFMNRVRFLAMKQRGLSEVDPTSLLDRWSTMLAKLWIRTRYPRLSVAEARVGTQPPADFVQEDPIPDDVLVSLVALESCPSLWNLIKKYKLQSSLPDLSGLDESTRTWLNTEKNPTLKQLSAVWPQLRLRLEQYMSLAGSVAVT